jgi:uncharacterized membrane protein YdjX (TVP38/TMEM64 family)
MIGRGAMPEAGDSMRDGGGTGTSGGWLRFLPLGLMILAAAVGYLLGWHRYLSLEHIAEHYDRLQGAIAGNLWGSLLLYMTVYVAIVALSLPGAAVATLAGGILFGWVVGGSASVIAATIGASIVFWIVRTSLGRLLAERAGPWLARLRSGFEENALSYLLFLRLVPAFPFFVVNVAPALLGVSFRTYVIGTLIGILPGTYAFAYFGRGLGMVIEQQHQAHLDCLALQANEPALDCHIGIDTSALPLTELGLAFGALALVALLPVLLKRWWPRKAI